ncbi:MAG: OmpA family protein, partial [Bacteroidales bacterium]|nr:OmpA family protein [Bacteroidales bacterium]
RTFSAGLEVGLRYKLGGSNRKTKQDMIREREEQKEKEAAQAQTVAQAQTAAQRAEDAEQRAATASEREAEANERAEKLAQSLKRIEDLLASTLARDGKVDRVTGEGGKEALKVDLDGDILFATDRSNLSKNSMNVLVPLVQILQENPQTTIDIFGHTDNVGSLRHNQKLSTDRANSVANFLTEMGVDRRQIRRIVGRNYSEPVDDNGTEEGRAKNRRVEVWVYVDRD